MKPQWFLLCLVTSIPGLSQVKDTFQPDSIYQKNKIKTRESSTHELCAYDRKGHLIEYTNFMQGKPARKFIYSYDTLGRLSDETEIIFENGREKNIYKGSVRFDKKGRAAKLTKYKNDGALYSEKMISYNPLIETYHLYKSGEISEESVSFFEAPNVLVKRTGERYSGQELKIKMSGKKTVSPSPNTYLYKFENQFDSFGRLIETKRFDGDKLQEAYFFKYNDKGLLTAKTRMLRGIMGNEESYVYTYWE